MCCLGLFQIKLKGDLIKMSETADLKNELKKRVNDLFNEVSWYTPRDRTEKIRHEAIKACHALHLQANPAYKERCLRENINIDLPASMLPYLVFKEEMYKSYSETAASDGKKLGVFCERDTECLINFINYHLIDKISSDNLSKKYMRFTSLKGGLDRLR